MIRKAATVLFLIIVMALVPLFTVNTKEDVNKSRYVADHILVKLKPSARIAAGSVLKRTGSEIVRELSETANISVRNVKQLFPPSIQNIYLYEKHEMGTFYVVTVEKGTDIINSCNKLEKSDLIDYAEPDFIGEAAGKSSARTLPGLKPNDEYFYRQWGLYNDGTVKTTTGRNGKSGADMNVLNGWDIEKGSESVLVAVLDSGVKLDHPELSGRLWVNSKETRNGRDDDGNSYVDDINGWNFAYDNNNVKDDGGHGTNIAGTIGANTNNSIGIAGLDQRCKIMVCKNLDEENLGEYSWWSASLYYAANNGARAINMSEGGYDYSKTLDKAVNYAYDAGCIIMASMMNKNNGDNYYPASLTNIMAIGATDTDDGRCREFTWGGGSNWGKHIAVVAPGNRIYGLDFKDNNNYEVYWSGTSQATAYVTAIASLLISQDPSRTNKQIREIICSTAKDQVGDPREDTPGWDEYYGYGRVDLYAALNYGNPANDDKDRNDKIEDKNRNDNKGKNNVNSNDNSDSSKDKRAKANDPNKSNNSEDPKRAKHIDH